MFSGFDHAVVYALQSVVVPSPTLVLVVIFLARWIVFINLALGLYLLSSRKEADRHAVYEAFWSLGLATLITTLASLALHRARPYLAFTDVTLLIPAPFNTSFPSGHTGVSFAIAFAFLKGNRRIGLVSLLLAVFTALSRMSVGVHFPTDILGGIVVGALSFALVRFGHRELRRRDIRIAETRHRHDV